MTGQSILNWFKELRNWILVAFIIVAILYIRLCKRGKETPAAIPVITRDTVYKSVRDTITKYVPKPVAVINKKAIDFINSNIPRSVVFDTIYAPQLVDTAEMLKDYYATRYYVDTAGTSYGDVIVKDSVSQNRIVSREWLTNFSIPTITETITTQQPKRFKFYPGITVMGSAVNPLFGYGVNGTFVTSGDKLYSIGILNAKGIIYYQVGAGFKITFRKQK